MRRNPSESGHVAKPGLGCWKRTRLAVELATFERLTTGATDTRRLDSFLCYGLSSYWSRFASLVLREPRGRETRTDLFLDGRRKRTCNHFSDWRYGASPRGRSFRKPDGKG